MEVKRKPYIVYVKINSDNCITEVNSSAFLRDLTGWLEIDSGFGDKHHHAQGNYFEKPVKSMTGTYQYKLIDGKPMECSVEEIKSQEEANKSVSTPSTEERFEALEAAVAMLCMPDVEV